MIHKLIRTVTGGNQERIELARYATSALGLKFLGLACGYVFTLEVAWTAGADAWGGFSLCLAAILIGTIVSRLGLDTALLRLIAAVPKEERAQAVMPVYIQARRVVVPTSVAVSCVLAFGAPRLAEVIEKPQLAAPLAFASLAIAPLALSFLSTQALRALRRIGESVFLDQVARFLFPAILYPIAYLLLPRDLAVVGSYAAGAVLIALLASYRLRRAVGLAGRAQPPRGVAIPPSPSTRALLRLGLPLLLASSLTFIKGYIDTIMLGAYASERDIGVYVVALKLASLGGLSLLAVNSIAAPKFAEAFGEKDMAKLERVATRATELVMLWTVPVMLVLVILPRQILAMFGPEFVAGSTALVILAMGQTANAWSGSVGNLLQMAGAQVAFQNITVAATVLGVVLNMLLVPRLGINGAAISTAATVALWNFACVAYAGRVLRVRCAFNPYRIVRDKING